MRISLSGISSRNHWTITPPQDRRPRRRATSRFPVASGGAETARQGERHHPNAQIFPKSWRLRKFVRASSGRLEGLAGGAGPPKSASPADMIRTYRKLQKITNGCGPGRPENRAFSREAAAFLPWRGFGEIFALHLHDMKRVFLSFAGRNRIIKTSLTERDP